MQQFLQGRNDQKKDNCLPENKKRTCNTHCWQLHIFMVNHFYFINFEVCHSQKTEPEIEYFPVMSSDRVSDFSNSTSKQKSIIE